MIWYDKACKRGGFYAYLATLFLGAFNDNVSKLLVICFGTAALGKDTPQAATFMSLAAAGFILPYLIFSSVAGYLADRFSKRSVMIWSKVAEIIIMLTGMLLASHNALYSLLLVLFAMGSQSAFFSPAKYGFLPETCPGKALSRANGLTQLFTFLAIIVGGWIGGLIAAKYSSNTTGGFVYCIAFAVIGTLTSFFITPTCPGDAKTKFHCEDPISPHWQTFKEMRCDHLMVVAILGNTFFWFLGTVFQLVLMTLVQNTLKGDNAMVGNLQGAVALGIGVGCVCAGVLSRGKICYHFVAPAALLMGIFALLLALFGTVVIPVFAFTILLGFCTGFYQLPLSTAIQERAPEEKRGRYIGASNALDCVSMLLATVYLWLLQSVCHCTPQTVIAITAALTLCVAAAMRNALKR